MKEIVKVVKNKDSGEIRTWVTLSERGASVPLNVFIEQICMKFGNPTFTFTNESLKQKMLQLVDEEIRSLKQATAQVVTEEHKLK